MVAISLCLSSGAAAALFCAAQGRGCASAQSNRIQTAGNPKLLGMRELTIGNASSFFYPSLPHHNAAWDESLIKMKMNIVFSFTLITTA
jgi:hypothetical protein